VNPDSERGFRTISVMIPVLNAADYLPKLLDALFSQKPVTPDEVILVDSQSTDATREIALSYPNVKVIPITQFSHGRARNLGAQQANGDIIILLSQDALPKDDTWLALLLAPSLMSGWPRCIPARYRDRTLHPRNVFSCSITSRRENRFGA